MENELRSYVETMVGLGWVGATVTPQPQSSVQS